MELAVVNTSGSATGKKVNLNDAIFSIEPNDHAFT
jgi:large subunit ribosomal protein L4